MEFENSDHVDSQTVAESCSTRLNVRKSRYGHLAERASEDFLKEWKSACGTEFLGCQSPVTGHIISLGLPEISPTRISVITKLSDFLFAIDGKKFTITSYKLVLTALIDIVTSKGANPVSKQMTKSFEESCSRTTSLER